LTVSGVAGLRNLIALGEGLFRRASARDENTQPRLGEKFVGRLGENERKVIHHISLDPFITTEELSQTIGISTVAVYKNARKLKRKGLIRRVGPDKGGHWEVAG
jgi:ATP-dependent DNA helicase RecG